MTLYERIITKPGYRILAAGLLVLSAYHIASLEPEAPKAYTYQQMKATQEQRLAGIYADKGSKEPQAMAAATMKLKRPVLAAAQAIVESNGNPKARGKAGEKGAWQVMEKWHGKAGRTAHEQAMKHEKIMDELLKATQGDVPKAVQSYNGSLTNPKTKVYLRKVQREALNIAKLM